MKVVRYGNGCSKFERADVVSFDVDDAVVALQLAVDQQKAEAGDGEALALE